MIPPNCDPDGDEAEETHFGKAKKCDPERDRYIKQPETGKKEGYVAASAEYEKKLLEQADLFLTQKNLFEQQKDEYEKLLDEYEAEIERLERKQKLTDAENTYLNQLLRKERALRKISQ